MQLVHRLPFPVSKSHAAFLLSADRLFTWNKSIYFWTWTFKDVYCHWQYSGLFNALIHEVAQHFRDGKHVNNISSMQGLRVVEHHKTHGLHYHMLVNCRIPLPMIKRLGEKFGLGRISVRRANPDAAFYLGKYLTKDKSDFHRGGGEVGHVKRWNAIGSFTGVRVNEIEVDSTPLRCIRQFTRVCGQLPYQLAAMVYNYGSFYGSVRTWDFKAKARFVQYARVALKPTESHLLEKVYNLLHYTDAWGEQCPPSQYEYHRDRHREADMKNWQSQDIPKVDAYHRLSLIPKHKRLYYFRQDGSKVETRLTRWLESDTIGSLSESPAVGENH